MSQLGGRATRPEGTMTKSTVVTLTCLLCLAAPAGVFGQGGQATITGVVTDTTGAAVAAVQIQVRNTQTNQLTPTVSDGAGHYTAPFLSPGSYSVSVEV